MVDFSIVDKSLKTAWVKRFYEADGSKWCSVFASVTAQYGGRFIFECNSPRSICFTSELGNWVGYIKSGLSGTQQNMADFKRKKVCELEQFLSKRGISIQTSGKKN